MKQHLKFLHTCDFRNYLLARYVFDFSRQNAEVYKSLNKNQNGVSSIVIAKDTYFKWGFPIEIGTSFQYQLLLYIIGKIQYFLGCVQLQAASYE